MLKVMKQAGLRIKKINVNNIPVRLEERVNEFGTATIDLDNKLSQVIKDKGHLVFLDEVIFKSRDFKRSAWSAPYQNLTVFDRTGK